MFTFITPLVFAKYLNWIQNTPLASAGDQPQTSAHCRLLNEVGYHVIAANYSCVFILPPPSSPPVCDKRILSVSVCSHISQEPELNI